jgi:hypothetical protein
MRKCFTLKFIELTFNLDNFYISYVEFKLILKFCIKLNRFINNYRTNGTNFEAIASVDIVYSSLKFINNLFFESQYLYF